MAQIVSLEDIRPGKTYWIESVYGAGKSVHKMTCSQIKTNTVHFNGPFRVKSEYLKQWWAWNENPEE